MKLNYFNIKPGTLSILKSDREEKSDFKKLNLKNNPRFFFAAWKKSLGVLQMLFGERSNLTVYKECKILDCFTSFHFARNNYTYNTCGVISTFILVFSLWIFFSFSEVAFAQPASKWVTNKINEILKDKFFTSSLAAIDVYDLSSNKIVYQRNNKLLLRPASNMKILTSAAALKYLGGDYQFKTSVYYQGEIVDSVLYGHLFVVGGCDPDFTSDDLEILTRSIKDLGVRKITGNIFGDVSMTDSLFWGNGWMWDDDPSTDAPYLSALNINDNAVTVSCWYDEKSSDLIVKSIPETEFIKFNKKLTFYDNEETNFTVDRDWINRTNNFLISGNISPKSPARKNSFSQKFNVFKPELYFLTLLKESLQRNNIHFTGDLNFKPLNGTVNHIFTLSRNYDSVIVNLNKTSDNLSTEMVLRAMAEKYFGKPATARNGIKMIDSLIILCGLNPSDYRLVDGSGVSHYNLVSAELLLAVLKYFYNEPKLFQSLYNSFPVAGIDGSLENRMKNTLAQNNVHAKTGTLSGVSSLSGFVKNKKGHMLAFSILIQNYVGSAKQARDFIDSVCVILAESN